MEAKRWWIPIARAGLSIKRSKELLLLALFGPRAMSDLSPECAPKQTSADRSELMGSRSGSRHSLLFAAANLCENKSFHRVQKLPRFAQQRLNLPSLGDRSSGEQAVLARVPVSPWRAGSRRAGERHAPPQRILAPQRGLASIARVLRAWSLMPVLSAWRPRVRAPVRKGRAGGPSAQPSPRAPG